MHDHCHDPEHHFHHEFHNHHAPDCDDQLPSFAHVGRGLKGDGFLVRISNPDDCTQTYLEGLSYDEATKEYHSEWISENINGGELSYQYNLRPFTDPRTFTITFIYRRPGRCEWSWTTPAIPYIWTIGDDGTDSNPDHIVGSGVATLFIRASRNDAWNERLHYPKGTTRDDYNAPQAGEAWSATITFGKDGDVQLPNFDELAKILGVRKGDIFNILEDKTFTIDGITATDYRDWLLKHLHKDLGFGTGDSHDWTDDFGGEATVKAYIDKKFQDLKTIINVQANHINNLYGLLDDIIGHIYGATKTEVAAGSSSSSTVPDDKGWKISWSPNAKIPQGNLNVYGGDSRGKYIKTHDNETNDDVWAR